MSLVFLVQKLNFVYCGFCVYWVLSVFFFFYLISLLFKTNLQLQLIWWYTQSFWRWGGRARGEQSRRENSYGEQPETWVWKVLVQLFSMDCYEPQFLFVYLDCLIRVLSTLFLAYMHAAVLSPLLFEWANTGVDDS